MNISNIQHRVSPASRTRRSLCIRASGLPRFVTLPEQGDALSNNPNEISSSRHPARVTLPEQGDALSNNPNEISSSRRAALFAAMTAIFAGLPAEAKNNGNPFAKELKNRRAKIPEDQFKVSPESPALKIYDVKVGGGRAAELGDRVAVHYEAKWKNITFMTSRQGMGVTGGSPLGFDVGAKPGLGGTLKALDLGVRGMRIGGQRKLIAGPELCYGDKGYGEIPPGATLEIDIQLLSIKQNAFGTQVKLVEG